jgi:hypothetical protein
MTEARDDQRADPHSAPKADDPIPCGCVKHCLRRERILAQQSAETITTVDTAARVAYGLQGARRWRRRSGAQRSMRLVPIVMVHKHSEGSLQMATVRNQHPVQTLGTHGPDEPFRDTVRLGRPNRRTQNFHTLAAKHGARPAVVLENSIRWLIAGFSTSRSWPLRQG